MFIAVALAIIFTANLPISFALIFVTNPLTMPAVFYGAYKLGAWIIGTEPTPEVHETPVMAKIRVFMRDHVALAVAEGAG